MDAPKRLLVAAAWLTASLHHAAADDSEKTIVRALADADRYAGGFADAHVSDAWERAEDGWVRGGYTLVSGDVRTAVRYAVDPSGEMRVMARRPGPTALTTPGAAQTAATHSRAGGPLLAAGFRPPFYQRLVHFGGLDDAFDGLDGGDFDDDDEAVDDDDPFFFDGPDGWDAAAAPVAEWARLRRAEDGRASARTAKCKSTKCRAGYGYAVRAAAASPLGPARAAPPATLGLPSGNPAEAASATFRTGHYGMVVKTVPAVEKPSR